MRTRHSRFFIPAFLAILSLGLAAHGVAQTVSVRSVVKWPMHEELRRAIGGGLQLHAGRALVLDFEIAGGTEHSSPCGGLVPPGQDCSSVDRDLSFLSVLIGYPLPFTTSKQWDLRGAPLAGIPRLESNATTVHVTLGFGIEGDRQFIGVLRLGAAARASMLFPPFRRECEDCSKPRGEVIPVLDLGMVVAFSP